MGKICYDFLYTFLMVLLFKTDLRKLIKYEERLGIKLNQPDYFHSLWQRTTNSFRAKTDKENATTKRNSKDASVKQIENPAAAATTSGAYKKTSSTVVQKTRQVLGEQNQLTARANKPRKSPDIANQPKQPAPYKNTHTNTNSTNTISSTTYKDILIDKEKSRQKKPHVIEKNITSKQTSSDFLNNEQRSSHYKESNRDNKKKAPPSGEKHTDDRNVVKKVHNRDVGPSAENRTGTVTDRDKHRVELNTRHVNEVGDVTTKTGITRKLRNPVNLPEWEPDQYTPRSRTKPISETGTFGGYSGGTAIPQIRTRTRNDRAGIHDPVKLYHYYQREWKRFSDQIPTGDNRAELRWQIRQMCLDPE